MKTLVRISVFVVFLEPMYAAADEDVSVPRGVVYKKASKAINDKAREKIKTLFSRGPEADLQAVFRQMLICGPFLWKEIRDEPEMRAIKTGRAMLKIPQYEGGKVTGIVEKEGKLFQGKEQVAAFWKAPLPNGLRPRTVEGRMDRPVRHRGEVKATLQYRVPAWPITRQVTREATSGELRMYNSG